MKTMAQDTPPAVSEQAKVEKSRAQDCSQTLRDEVACAGAPAAKAETTEIFEFPGHSHGTKDEDHDAPHNGWATSVHGDIKLQLNHQSKPRGTTAFDSVNWIAVEAERDVKGGELSLRGTFSLEPWTTPGGGSPQLFQSGGAYKGQTIIDAQHPHNFLSEASIRYARPVAENTKVSIAGGIGAPALGPIYFHEHDLTLGTDLSHHWLEGTHISNGFATVGVQHRNFQLEGSAFHGRESDDRRAITVGALESYSVRAAYAPTENFVIQVSRGHIKSPESLEPGDVERTTFSAAHRRQWSDGSLQSLIGWGINNEEHGKTNAFRAESILNFHDKNYLFGRYEWVEKHDLAGPNVNGVGAGDIPEETTFPIRSFSVGAMRDIVKTDDYRFGIGADLTFYKIPGQLKPVYGSDPISGRIALRLTF